MIQTRWHRAVMLATWVPEVGGSQVQGHSEQHSQILSQKVKVKIRLML